MNSQNLVIISILLALLPFLLVLGTAYLKVSIVLNIFKNAIGAQQVPSGVVIGTLSLVISLMIMEPVFNQNQGDLLLRKLFDISQQKSVQSNLIEDLAISLKPWKNFIEDHAGQEEIAFLTNLRKNSAITSETSNLFLLITAFLLSELKEAFQMGLMILFPFLIIDFLVANLLAGLGMMMFSPILLSLPLKILTIVVLDFWQLIFQALMLSYS